MTKQDAIDRIYEVMTSKTDRVHSDEKSKRYIIEACIESVCETMLLRMRNRVDAGTHSALGETLEIVKRSRIDP